MPYPHFFRGIYKKQTKVDNLNSSSKTIDSSHKQFPGLNDSIVSPQGGVEQCANIRKALKVLRRSVFYDSPKRRTAYKNIYINN